MADPAVDPKAAPLSDDLKEFALTLNTTSSPKNLSCALCSNFAIDAYKLLCCNKPICSSCQATLQFPTMCPLCEHSPLEAESCTVHKVLRNTIRVWLQKQKKKEEKAASEVVSVVESAPMAEPTPAPEADSTAAAEITPTPADQPGGGDADMSAFKSTTTGGATGVLDAIVTAGEETQQAGSSTSQPGENSTAPQDEGNQNTELNQPEDGQQLQSMNGQANPMLNNNQVMYQNGMPGQFGGFNNGMGYNSMNSMNGMQNMYMNSMDYGMNSANGMYNNFGGGMGMGMNDMSAMNYGGGYGNGWNGTGGAVYGGYNNMAGYNQSGAYSGMMNQFPNKNNYSHQNRFHANGGVFPHQGPNSHGGHGVNFNSNRQPGSGSGPRNNNNQRDGESPAGSAGATAESKTESEHDKAPAETSAEGKNKANTQETANPDSALGENAQGAETMTETAGTDEKEATTTLNKIQTVDTVVDETESFDYAVQSGMEYPTDMMSQYPVQTPYMNGGYQQGYNMNNFDPRGGHGDAYGHSTLLVGEPRGLGVAGAPTGPKAMRERNTFGRPNNPRFAPQPPRATPVQTQASDSPHRVGRSKSPVRDEALRTKERSPSRSRSRSPGREETREAHRKKTQPADNGDQERALSRTPAADDSNDRQHHRSSRYDDEREDYDNRHRGDRNSRGNRTRSTSVESKYRSRRDLEKHRTSRSHRDRSRDHRHRHRSYSRSPVAEGKYGDDEGSGSRRKSKIDKDKHRERDRSRDRDRERDRDRRDRKDRDYEDDKHRSRDKERDRRRRRDREPDGEERDYEDDKHRSSRRSRKDRAYEKSTQPATSGRPVSPPINAPVGPSADRFSFRGASSKSSKIMPPPPTGPRGITAPKGPSADRDDTRRRSSVSSAPPTPVEPSIPDHYAAERERNARERAGLERSDTRDSYHNGHTHSKSVQPRISTSRHSTSRPSESSKRSHDEVETVDGKPELPTGPASHRDKRRKSRDGDGNGGQLANLFTKGLRKKAGKRGGVKTEGEVERELERTERERDSRRW